MIESKVYLDLARIWNVGPGEVQKIVEDYIGAVTCDFESLKPYPKPRIHIRPVKIKTLKERLEEYEMKATSTQEIKNVKDISFSFVSNPIEMNSKLTIVATTNDDIFEIVFEGEHLIQSCKNTGMFDGLEKDLELREMKIRNKGLKEEYEMRLENQENTIHKLKEQLQQAEKELGEWKKEAVDCLRVRDEVRREKNKEINELKQQLQQAANDKKRLTYKIAELEELQTSTIENFTDEKPSNRRDILKAAEKCVCGQREQDYGTPESNFQLIADLWNGYLFPSLQENKAVISAKDVAMLMSLMKIARIRNGGGSGDSFVDLAGYAACGGEIWALQKEIN